MSVRSPNETHRGAVSDSRYADDVRGGKSIRGDGDGMYSSDASTNHLNDGCQPILT